MISKHMKGREFSRCLRYVLKKPGAQLLGGNLFSADLQTANAEMHRIACMSARTTRPLLHCALSLAPGESLSPHQWRMLTQDYLDALGLNQNQYLLVRHTDTPTHEHVHLIVNRVRMNGKTVSDSWDYMRSQVVVQQLETQYGLVHAPRSWEKRQRKRTPTTLYQPLFSDPPLDTLPASVQQQVKWQRQLRGHLNSALVTAWDLESFTEQLAHEEVQLRLLNRQGKAVGISFRWQGQKIAGSRLGAAYSLPKLLAVMKEAISPRSSVEPGMEQAIAAGQQDGEQPAAIHDPEEEEHQFEPDETLPAAHQRYLQLEARVQQQVGSSVTRRQIDLQIARWALHSNSPAESRALVYSPEIQRLKRQQGEPVAMDVLKQLMREAQQQGPSKPQIETERE